MGVDANGLTRPIIDELDLRQTEEDWYSVANHELGLDRRADDLFRWNAIDLFDPGPHELDATARHDERLEAVAPQIGQQLDHRLVDEFGIGPLEFRMLCRGKPIGDHLREDIGRHAGMRGQSQLHHAALARFGEGLHVAFEYRLEGLLVLPLRMQGCHRLDTFEHEGKLEIHRLLGPQGAVVVEHRDALGRRYEVW